MFRFGEYSYSTNTSISCINGYVKDNLPRVVNRSDVHYCFDQIAARFENGVLLDGCYENVFNGKCIYKCYFPYASLDGKYSDMSSCSNGTINKLPKCFLQKKLVITLSLIAIMIIFLIVIMAVLLLKNFGIFDFISKKMTKESKVDDPKDIEI
ncbi:hypothetical protein MHBO_001900 [Bonamia ostreae]|uniref:Uncharacterized protein n=1 Tax=Bonamia ostreae TaxID=126728 RepID=A0ABV2AKL7_9EUKA